MLLNPQSADGSQKLANFAGWLVGYSLSRSRLAGLFINNDNNDTDASIFAVPAQKLISVTGRRQLRRRMGQQFAAVAIAHFCPRSC